MCFVHQDEKFKARDTEALALMGFKGTTRSTLPREDHSLTVEPKKLADAWHPLGETAKAGGETHLDGAVGIKWTRCHCRKCLIDGLKRRELKLTGSGACF